MDVWLVSHVRSLFVKHYSGEDLQVFLFICFEVMREGRDGNLLVSLGPSQLGVEWGLPVTWLLCQIVFLRMKQESSFEIFINQIKSNWLGRKAENEMDRILCPSLLHLQK